MRLLYISTGSNFPPDKHLLDGLRSEGHEVIELIFHGRGPGKYVRFARRIPQHTRGADAVIVGYGLPLVVPVIRSLTCKKILFNAVASQYEANVISRGEHGMAAALKWSLIDFVSFHLSSFVLLESRAQVEFVRRHFLLRRNKLIVGRMGVDESVFFQDRRVPKRAEFTVLFRGRFLPESGILTVIRAAKKLEKENIQFLIIGHGFLYREVHALMKELHPENVELIEETLPAGELREKMLSCHLCLGQLADHPRLLRTLPAKLYESLALGLPYLTGRNVAVLELLAEDETCIAVEPGNPDALAEKILYLKRHPEILKRVGEAGYQLYTETLTSAQLAKDFLDACFRKESARAHGKAAR